MSAKEHFYGRKRRPSKGREGTRTALYLRVSTADQKPDLQYDGLRAYAAHASLEVVQDYCDVGLSGLCIPSFCSLASVGIIESPAPPGFPKRIGEAAITQ